MKKLLYTILFLTLAISSFAQDDISFTAQANNTVAVGQQFRLIYSVNAKGSGFTAPTFTNFDILAGPSQSSSSSMQIINGNVSQSYSYSFTYILAAKKEGKFTIKPAKIKVNGKIYTSNPLTINVVKGNANVNNQNNTTNNQVNTSNVSDKNIFVRVYLNKNTAYEGEQIVATVKIYTRVGIAGFDDINFPSYDNFFSQEIPTPNNISFVRENVNGTIYNVGVLQKMLLYPQKSGKITIKPFKITAVVQQRVRRRSNSFFDDFFSSGYQNVKKVLRSNSVSVNVKPLPNKPADFNGAVGHFNLSANIDKTSTKADEPVTLKVKISGNGNLKLIDDPNFDFPPDFDVYDPKIKNNIKNDASGAHGTISYEYLMIPRNGGDFTIKPYKFTYFDIKTKKYVTLTTDEFKIHVDKTDGNSSKTVVNNISKENVKYLNKDIRYIKTSKINLKPVNNYFFGSLPFYLSYIFALIIFVAIYLLKRKSIKQNANIAAVKNKKANKVAKKRLKLASKYLKEQNSEQFYQEITNAIWGYLSDKLNIQYADLTKEKAVNSLLEKGITKEKTDELIDILDKCEFARFSSATSTHDLTDVYNKATKIISDIENKI